MSDLNFVPRQPDFSGDGVSVWSAVTKDGKHYLSVKITWIPNVTFKVFKRSEREVQVVEETTKM
jgi:hypothetical protein